METVENIRAEVEAILGDLDRCMADDDFARGVAEGLARETLRGYFGCEGFKDMAESPRDRAVKRTLAALRALKPAMTSASYARGWEAAKKATVEAVRGVPFVNQHEDDYPDDTIARRDALDAIRAVKMGEGQP